MVLTFDRLRGDVAEALFLSPGELDPDSDLFAAGLDSMRALALLEGWRPDSGRAVGFLDLLEQPTLAAWWRLLAPRQEH
ncbi:phosphopantetheine attachment domain protein [Nocardia terpenica]